MMIEENITSLYLYVRRREKYIIKHMGYRSSGVGKPLKHSNAPPLPPRVGTHRSNMLNLEPKELYYLLGLGEDVNELVQ